MKVARSYEQHLGNSESRMHAATATIPPLPEVPGTQGWVPDGYQRESGPCEDRQSTSSSFQGSSSAPEPGGTQTVRLSESPWSQGTHTPNLSKEFLEWEPSS